MLKIKFSNAKVEDRGFGLEVNGRTLEEVISEALGTRAKGVDYNDPRLKRFEANSCDVTVLIDPHESTTHIETDDSLWNSLEELEEGINGKFSEETPAAES